MSVDIKCLEFVAGSLTQLFGWRRFNLDEFSFATGKYSAQTNCALSVFGGALLCHQTGGSDGGFFMNLKQGTNQKLIHSPTGLVWQAFEWADQSESISLEGR